MVGGLRQVVGEVEAEPGLNEVADQQVGKPVGEHAVQRVRPVGPALAELHAVLAHRVEAQPADQPGGHLEARGVDQQVEFVLGAVDHGPFGVDLLHTASVGVHEVHVGLVERFEIFVVEGDSLAVLAIPGLELLGGLRIVDHVVDAGSQRLHDLEVVLFESGGLLRRCRLALGVGTPDFRPFVADQILLGMLAADDRGEAGLALGLPAGLEGLPPLGVGEAVVPHAHRGRGPLEDVDLLGGAGELGHHLHRRGAGADDAHPLVGQGVHRLGGAAAGEVVVPTGGVKGPALEVLDALDGGQLGLVQDAAGCDQKLGGELVATGGGDVPARHILVPHRCLNFGLEQRVGVEVEVATDALGVLEDLGGRGVALAGHVAGLFEERHVDVRLDVALAARVPVPIPGAAEVARLLDDAKVGNAAVDQVDPQHHAAEATPDDDRFGLLDHRVAGEARLDPGIVVVLLVVVGQLCVLRQTVGAQTLLALALVAFAGGCEGVIVGLRHDLGIVQGDLRAKVCPLTPTRAR